MKDQPITPEERFNMIIETLQSLPGITPPWEGPRSRGFGALGLKIHDKTFAILSKENLVLKLPQSRVDILVTEGYGERYNPRRVGRSMREWISIEPAYDAEWLPLAREAMEFVNPLKTGAE
jgi:hypothetical protein